MEGCWELTVGRAPLRCGCKPFTLRRANRAVVLVQRIVADVVGDYCRLMELQEILELEQQYGPVSHLQQVEKEMSEAASRLRGYLAELDAVGVVLRDFARGVVDFPACVAGRDVFYCWQLGEDRVQYWHGRDEALAGRKCVSELVGLPAPAGAEAP